MSLEEQFKQLPDYIIDQIHASWYDDWVWYDIDELDVIGKTAATEKYRRQRDRIERHRGATVTS